MGNYTPNPFMTQSIYDPSRPFATPIGNNTDYVRGDASIHNMHARESFFASKTKTYEQCNYKILHKN